MAINENENKESTTSDNTSSRSKESSSKSDNNKENDNNSNNSSESTAIDNLSEKLKQKKREVDQLGINPEDILEEEEKRQPFCKQE